jgi:hypothetical protein
MLMRGYLLLSKDQEIIGDKPQRQPSTQHPATNQCASFKTKFQRPKSAHGVWWSVSGSWLQSTHQGSWLQSTHPVRVLLCDLRALFGNTNAAPAHHRARHISESNECAWRWCFFRMCFCGPFCGPFCAEKHTETPFLCTKTPFLCFLWHRTAQTRKQRAHMRKCLDVGHIHSTRLARQDFVARAPLPKFILGPPTGGA